MPYQTINPFTEKLVKTFTEQTDEQLQSIIAQAEDTYSNDWSKRSLAARKKILKNAVKIFREKREEFAQYITLEMGKLLTESRGEVDLSADILEYYADNAEAFLAPEKLKVSGGEAVVENAPLGVLFCIDRTKNVVFIGITSRQRTEEQKTNLYTKLVEELKACGIVQIDIVVSIVTNSDADWSFGNGRAQFLTGEL